jgi:hypothetical protein
VFVATEGPLQQVVDHYDKLKTFNLDIYIAKHMFKLKLLVFLDIYITKHMFILKLLVFLDIYIYKNIC